MKRFLGSLLLCLFVGCEQKVEPKPEPPETKIVLLSGMIDCKECSGDGKIDIEGEAVHCPRCDGFGKLVETTPGLVEQCSTEFKRGYTDRRNGVDIKDCPYMLRFRRVPWRNGWLAAKEEYEVIKAHE